MSAWGVAIGARAVKTASLPAIRRTHNAHCNKPTDDRQDLPACFHLHKSFIVGE
jgi:hypothetical protein